MRATKITVGLGLASVIAVAIVALQSGVVAHAVLPAPEFLSNKKPITKISFTDTSGFGQIAAGSTTLTWTGASAKGVLEPSGKLSGVVLSFTGDKISGCEVNSPGAKKGEVVTKELRGVLGYVNETTPIVGVLFEPVTPSTFLEVETSKCNSTLVVKGSIIGKISRINEENTRFTLAFGGSSKKQEVTKFEGEATEHRLSIGEATGFFECQEGLTTGEKVEIKT
jgi:hypothetical protein